MLDHLAGIFAQQVIRYPALQIIAVADLLWEGHRHVVHSSDVAQSCRQSK